MALGNMKEKKVVTCISIFVIVVFEDKLRNKVWGFVLTTVAKYIENAIHIEYRLAK